MLGSTNHASSVGLIRNLGTGYISPQYHLIYNNEFQIVMGGFEDNKAVATHIWYSLSSENVLEHAHAEHHHLPRLQED